MTTSKRLTAKRGADEPTLFVVGSRAKIFLTPAEARALKATAAGCGSTCSESFAEYDRNTSSWKTLQRCLVGGWAEFSEAWPRAGTTRNGIASRRRPLVPLTDATASGLLPTLGKNENKGSSRKRFDGSRHFRGAKMSEGVRTSEADPIYLNPWFAELAMGFPAGWTVLPPSETPSSRKSSK